jgi:hypothetical protein
MLKMIAEAHDQSWRCFLTGDELWFCHSTGCEPMWVPRGEMASTRARHIISTPKVLIAFFSPRLGFPVNDALPAGEKFRARYFCDNIVPQIAKQRSLDTRQDRGRKFVVHMDDGTPERAKLTKSCCTTLRLREADHSAYSPDIAPSDFSLFGKLKRQMAGSEFESPEDLLATMRRLTNAISREELGSVFQECERILEECIRISGDYVS